jgi:probable F420-dependent oxidoreductase
LKVDGALLPRSLAESGALARRLESAGYDGAFTFEGQHDPFFPLVLAAAETERLELATAVAIAFARSPMLLANVGHDLQVLSKGRFILGLGSQIRPHIEKRFSMPWSRPAARMRELVLAVRAIWRAWNEGEPLRFKGEFYIHTLMTPFFSPPRSAFGPPRIFLAGVGPQMTEVAGEVGDGFFVHPLHSERSIAEITLPALKKGLTKSGRNLASYEVAAQLLVAAGESDEQLASARNAVKSQIAFYGSTPAYRPVLECHGFAAIGEELNGLSKRGDWAGMARLVPDALLEAVAVCGKPGEIADLVRRRCAGYATRVALVAPYAPDPETWAEIARGIRV